jgi:hypothetical protein
MVHVHLVPHDIHLFFPDDERETVIVACDCEP